MSDMKYDAIIASGIKIVERVPIPPELIPKDAQVEIAAKVWYCIHHIMLLSRMKDYVSHCHVAADIILQHL
jgi:hypothetical protein